MSLRIVVFWAVFFTVPFGAARANVSSGIKQRLKEITVKKVKSACPSCKVTVHCKWISPAVLKKSSGDVKDLIFAKPGIPAGYVTAKVIFKNNTPRNNKIQLYVSVRERLPVARTLIKRNETIHKSDLDWQWKDISRLSKKPIGSTKKIGGKTTIRVIRKGQVFYPSDLAGQSVVRAGDHVSMIYNQGGLRININCIARETKKTGQEIRLFSKKTGRLYMGKIISKNKIIWEQTL
jgi:flagella basal body P-ring formation protein FlgA